MPLLNIKTNTDISDKNQLALAASKTTSEALGKSENYVMVCIEDNQALVFAGDNNPAAYLELKSINLPESETAQISSALCELVSDQLGIDKNRIYIEFSNAERHMWGWNGATF